MCIPATDPQAAALGGPSPLPPLPPLFEESGRQLWNRNFRLFFVARTAALFGDGMIPVALTAGLLGAGRPASSVGYALACWMGPLAVFVLFGGVLADRFTPRRMMIIADALRLVGASVLAVSFAAGNPPLWAVYALSSVAGVGAALFQPGVASTVPRVAPDVQRANATLRVSEALMTMAGPAFAGVLVGLASAGAVYAANASTFLVSGACLFLLRLAPAPSDEAPRGSFLAELVDGWREFTARSWLWGVIAVWTVYGFAVLGPMLPLTAVRVTEAHGSGTYGAMMAVNGAGSVVGGLLALRLRPRRPLAAGAVALTGVCANLVVLGLGLSVPALGAGQFVAGAASAFWLVMWSTTVQTHVPPESLNRLHAYDVAGSLLMVAAGRALAGPLADELGAPEVLFAGAVVNVLAVAVLLAARPIRRLERIG
ncbi:MULTISPECIES: MFS transporter [unclassified Streptomyces]|uniref:MFS transporter n=1 Tax=unclassified Streptomyces TaxID=2593676 RepID=UPI00093AF3A1|nr:MFS transporter [Streptomyces sp. CB01249]NEC08486.1 MFS transporter [Streptomyces sp. SID7909]OKJ01682.1 MFS transporter [Streptomyces sp. CB01249]